MTRSLRVLIPEDSEDDARLLVRELSKLGYRPDFQRVDDRAGMRAALEQESWDLILCDYSMPQFTALDALAMVQEMQLDIPFIIISGDVGEDVAVGAMKAGAHDYLMKGELSRLGEAIGRELVQVKIRAERAEGIAHIKHLNRVLQAIRGINRLVVEEKDPRSLLQSSANLLVESRGYPNAAFVRTDGEKEALPFVAALDQNARHEVKMDPIPLSEIPKCLRKATDSDHAVVLREEQPDCSACPFRELHEGKTRLAGTLGHADKIFGFAVISLPHGQKIQEFERQLFDEMVADVGFALNGIALGEEKRESQERFQRLYENMAQGVVYQDAQGKIIRCNKAAEQMLGLSLSQMQGRTSLDPRWRAVHEDGSEFPGKEHPAMRALHGGAPASGVMGIHNPAQDQHRWISISAVPEFEKPEGPPSGVFTTFEDITRIRDAEAQLREAQSLAGLGRWALDLRDNSLHWSESIYELFEVDPGSFAATYEALLEFIHPDDRQVFDAAYRTSVETKSSYSLVHRLQMPDGRIKWVKEMGNTTYADDGTALRSVGTVQDVTELKAAEEDLRAREEQYRALFEGAPIGIFKTTSDGRVLSVNPALVRMLGHASVKTALTRKTDLGTQLHMSEERREAFVSELEARGLITGFEYEARTHDSRKVWLSLSARVAERLEDGSFTIEGFTSEITKRKQYEEELARSEHLLNLTGRIAKVGGWEFDMATRSPYLSEEVLRIYEIPLNSRLTVDEGVEYYHPEDMPVVQEAFARAVESGEGYEFEARLISANGTQKWVHSIGKPHFEDGNLTKIYGTIQDISQRKQREMEQEHLEHQLNHAQKMELVGELAGGVAHDFNNHLTVILGFAELAARELREDDPLCVMIQEVIKAGKRSATLTRQLLAFSRRQVLELRIVCLNEIIADMEKMLSRLIGEDIEMLTLLADNLSCVLADAGQIEQVLMNLTVNARDAMPNGGRLTIETAEVILDEEYVSKHAGAVTGPQVMLAVSDNGEGMGAETMARIFEPFFTTKEKGKGTGLGLATVYGIVKQSRGTINVYSELGHGTTFKIYLPLAKGAKQPVKQRPGVSQLGGNETVLVVEDDDAVRKLAMDILEKAGYNVLTASNAGEALLECERNREGIQLLLTDVVMPKFSGRELADRLKVLLPGLKVLFMSGFTDQAIVHHGVLDAGTDFIGKPFHGNDLLCKVREALDAVT